MGTFVLIIIIAAIIIFVIKAITNDTKQEAPTIEPYSPNHINSIQYGSDKTELQKQNLWETEFADRDIIWQGIISSIESMTWDREIVIVHARCDGVFVELSFPATEKDKLLKLSPGSTIRFSSKLPKLYPGQLTLRLVNANLI